MLLIQGLWVECKVCLSHEVGLRWQNIFLEIVQSTSKRQITCKIFFLYQTRTFLHKGILLITFNLLGLPDTQNTTWRCFSLMNWYKKITLPFNKLSVIFVTFIFFFSLPSSFYNTKQLSICKKQTIQQVYFCNQHIFLKILVCIMQYLKASFIAQDFSQASHAWTQVKIYFLQASTQWEKW